MNRYYKFGFSSADRFEIREGYTANNLMASNNWLGDYFRRIKAKGGHKYAIIATARKIAIIYYRMVRYREDFTRYDYEQYKEKFRLTKIASLEKVLKRLKNEAA